MIDWICRITNNIHLLILTINSGMNSQVTFFPNRHDIYHWMYMDKCHVKQVDLDYICTRYACKMCIYRTKSNNKSTNDLKNAKMVNVSQHGRIHRQSHCSHMKITENIVITWIFFQFIHIWNCTYILINI